MGDGKEKWQYLDNTIEDIDLKFEITPPSNLNIVLPQTLFKYYALNCNSVDALRNKYIYAPDPGQLNDPYDCFPGLTKFNNDQINKGIELLEEEFQTRFTEKQSLMINNIRQFNFFGVISMTSCPKNTLMWAHYAQNEGFALEFNYSKFDKTSFLGPFPINYTKEFESINRNELGIGWSSFLRQTNIKSEVWKYEKEWRFIAHKKQAMHLSSWGEKENPKSNRKFQYTDSLISITLGSLFFSMDKFDFSKGYIGVNLTGLKLCVVQFALENNIDLYWIVNPTLPSIDHLDGFNLLRRPIQIEQINDNNYKLSILEV